MTKPVAVYHAKNKDSEFMFALSRDGNTYEREFKRHTRFGKKWSEWRVTSFESVISSGYEEFKRVDKDVTVVLPSSKV